MSALGQRIFHHPDRQATRQTPRRPYQLIQRYRLLKGDDVFLPNRILILYADRQHDIQLEFFLSMCHELESLARFGCRAPPSFNYARELTDFRRQAPQRVTRQAKVS